MYSIFHAFLILRNGRYWSNVIFLTMYSFQYSIVFRPFPNDDIFQYLVSYFLLFHNLQEPDKEAVSI